MTTRKTAKDQMIAILGEQPDDSSFDHLLAELVFARMVERGLADSDKGRTISHSELVHRVASWSTRKEKDPWPESEPDPLASGRADVPV